MGQPITYPKIHGTVNVNSKGQIVIPSEVRSMLSLQEGDQLMVLTNGEYGLGLIKADNLHDFLSAVKKEHPDAFCDIDIPSSLT